MKSAYELAMERLEKSAPTVKLNDEQKAWHDAWKGQVCVVRCLEDVGRIVEAARYLPTALATSEAV